MNYYEFSKWSIQICKKSEKGNLNLASRSLEFTQIKPDKYILTALFIRVTIYSLNPLPLFKFLREVPGVTQSRGGGRERRLRLVGLLPGGERWHHGQRGLCEPIEGLGLDEESPWAASHRSRRREPA